MDFILISNSTRLTTLLITTKNKKALHQCSALL
jgi:hypothetical protein